MTSRIERCKRCRVQLLVPPEAQVIRCSVCQHITHVQHHNQRYTIPATSHYNGHINGALSNMNVMGTSRNAYYPIAGMSGYSYYPPPLQMSPPPVHGRKRAVLCGVSYHGQQSSLKGSINNVKFMKCCLVDRLGFPNASILVLTEDESDPSRIPTKCNIQTALHWLVEGCQSVDSLVFYYSGHGSRMQDLDGDEIDGYDESLCPVDYKTAGKILDDEINATIVRPLPRGAKLHAIIDTCFSGTVLDLQHMCRMNREGHYIWEDHRIARATYKGTNGGIAISFSACDDNQNSGDTTAFTGNAIGALTYSFIQTVENEPRLTYGRLLNAMRNKISEAQKGLGQNGPFASPASQVPQLSSSEKFNIYSDHFML